MSEDFTQQSISDSSPSIALTAVGYVELRVPSLGLPCASANSSDVYHVTGANIKRTAGPAIQPMVEVDHARASSSEPTLDVMMWAAAVTQVPA